MASAPTTATTTARTPEDQTALCPSDRRPPARPSIRPSVRRGPSALSSPPLRALLPLKKLQVATGWLLPAQSGFSGSSGRSRGLATARRRRRLRLRRRPAPLRTTANPTVSTAFGAAMSRSRALPQGAVVRGREGEPRERWPDRCPR